jgi:hypothetical protein
MRHSGLRYVTFPPRQGQGQGLRRFPRFATPAVAVVLVAAALAAVLPAPTASADIWDSVTASSAAGNNGVIDPLYTGPQLAAWLDNGRLDSLRAWPTSDTTIQPWIENGVTIGVGTATAEAHIAGPNLGATASAQADYTHPPNSETIAQGFGYLRDRLSAKKRVSTAVIASKFTTSIQIEGHVKLSGDARAQVVAVERVTDALRQQYTNA